MNDLSVIVPESILVRLVLAEVTAHTEQRRLQTEFRFHIDNARLLPDIGSIIVDMLGCPEPNENPPPGPPGTFSFPLEEVLAMDMLGIEPTEEAARAFILDARQRIVAARETI